jgi:hypothetical protein
MIDTHGEIHAATAAPDERITTPRSGRRSLIALLATVGGVCAIAGAALPWLTVYYGLDSYSGIAGTNGRLLAAGGAAAALLGLVYRLRAAALLRYLIGGLGFLLALFSAYLVAQLLSIDRELHGIFLPSLGPGVFLGAGGSLLIFSTLFVAGESDLSAFRQREKGQSAGLGAASASLVALSAAAGTIHLTVASDHFAEYFLFGLFFVVVGVAQLAWAAVAAIAGPVKPLLLLSLGNALIVVLWAGSRTTGVPLGPHPGVPEPVGYADVVTTVFELALVSVAVALLLRPRLSESRRDAPLWGVPLLVAPTTALAVLSAVGAIGFLPTSH